MGEHDPIKLPKGWEWVARDFARLDVGFPFETTVFRLGEQFYLKVGSPGLLAFLDASELASACSEAMPRIDAYLADLRAKLARPAEEIDPV